MVASKCFCKYSECPDGSPSGTCHIQPGGYCFTYFEEIQEHKTLLIEKRFGCFKPGEEALFQCKGYLLNHHIYKNISCCNNEDYCNQELLTEIEDGKIVYEEKFLLENLGTCFDIVASILVVLLLMIILGFFIKYRFHNSLQKKIKKKKEEDNNSQKLLLPSQGTPSIKLDCCYDLEQNHHVPYSFIKTISSSNTNSFGGSSDSSGYCSGGFSSRYSPLNNTHNSSQNGSNYTIDSNNLQSPSYHHFLSSAGSNTTSSLMSEITQQTILSSQKPGMNSLKPGQENSVTSGSGSGVPRLVQKTIGREIDLKGCIGRGRFGKVWLGVRHCEKYAVKIFFSRHESSWRREKEIYERIIMRHENIVTFLSTDIISYNGCTQLWLITQFYELGSLYDYLNYHPIENVQQMLSLMKSIILGLSHLHTEVNGTQGKPIIAHRDLKSKNILMKSETCCCIGDFASATTKAQNDSQLILTKNNNYYNHYHFGTKLYMAPEILSESINPNNFEEYLYSDIYSLGLVFWEIFNRLSINGTVNDYSKPYQEYVSDDPTTEEMFDVVCNKKIRPPLFLGLDDLHLKQNQILFYVARLINECWSSNPYARLTSLRVKKTIIDLQQR